jgi:hypothetical protein
MSWLTSQVIPSLQTLKILGDVDAFSSWLKTTYPEKNVDELFEGYKFSLICCLNCFIDGISNDELLGIKNDFLLNCAISQNILIDQIENTCEKTVFLKNLKPLYKEIKKAKSYNGIIKSLEKFNQEITSKFDEIFMKNISVSNNSGLDKETATSLLLIDYAQNYLVQIKNNGPIANSTHPLSANWTDPKLKEISFEGYKYAIQFLWLQLLGEKEFNQTHLVNIHLAVSWRDYKYIEKEKSEDPIFDDIFNQEFNLEEQTSFDSYFYWIRDEITNPLHNKYKTDIYTIESYFKFQPHGYDKQAVFSTLLKQKEQKNEFKLSWDAQIQKCLLWYPFEIVNSGESTLFQGITSFNTFLAGTITLHDSNKSEFSKIVVAKFTHPHPDSQVKNDYSYGVLLDSKSAAGHNCSGWTIFQDACGDYSGFSGREHKSTEKLIQKYLKDKKMELRELSIPLEKFNDFTNSHAKSETERSIIEQNKLIPDIIQKSKSYLLELITYYVCSRKYAESYFVTLCTGNKSDGGEKDIVLLSRDEKEVVIIECKLNPQSYSMKTLAKKLEAKLLDYHEYEKKSVQLWCWEKLSIQNKQLLEQLLVNNKPIICVEFSNPKNYPVLNGINLKQLRFIMQDYTRNNMQDFDDVPEYSPFKDIE